MSVYTIAVEGDNVLCPGIGGTPAQNDALVKEAEKRMRVLIDGLAIRIKVRLPE